MQDLRLSAMSDEKVIRNTLTDALARQRAIGQELGRWYDFIATERRPDAMPNPINQIDRREV
jgi:hypothetical protein